MTGWKVVQLFLGKSGVDEVSLDEKNMKCMCTCSAWATANRCKHTSLVQARIKTNGGKYPVHIDKAVAHADVLRAQENAENFRNFIIKYGKVEVL